MAKVNVTYLQDGSVATVAEEPIEAGIVLEQCPVLKLVWRSNYHNDPAIKAFAFKVPCNSSDCNDHGNALFFPLGWGMLYRQNSQPNCNIYLSDDQSTMTVQANQNIKPGTLLTINKESIPAPVTVQSLNPDTKEFAETDLGDDEEFMKKMATLIESQNNS